MFELIRDILYYGTLIFSAAMAIAVVTWFLIVVVKVGKSNEE